ncbi:hypothetical protein [Oligoflexus sp.]|uniref:hypothetical protein n=1 Tax=Oligoflexus sp. TaxID=1971216 RepID=UPI002D79DB41|nr:hypothetical protein [Oligoflexus sp.]
MKTVLRHHHGLLGRWPTHDLLLVETEEYEPVNVAGLVIINRPQQALMRHLQEGLLNWKIWQLTMALAEQWFGYQVQVGRLQDVWLTQSLADSLSLLFLKDSEEYDNLFTGDDDNEAWSQLNFSQVQDLIAATLSLMQSHNALLGHNQKSMLDRGYKTTRVQTVTEGSSDPDSETTVRPTSALAADPALSISEAEASLAVAQKDLWVKKIVQEATSAEVHHTPETIIDAAA